MLLDEPTNNLDIASIDWLEEYLLDFPGTVIVVSHDRHFLNMVCTHIIDIDFSKVQLYVGNYDFWYESSQLMQKLKREQNKKNEDKVKELQSFIERFSATNQRRDRRLRERSCLISSVLSRCLSPPQISLIGFQIDREPGKEILTVERLSKSLNGEQLLKDVSFRVNKGDKIAIIGDNENAITALFKILWWS